MRDIDISGHADQVWDFLPGANVVGITHHLDRLVGGAKETIVCGACWYQCCKVVG